MEKKHLVCLVSLKHLPPFFLPCFLPHSLLPPTSFSTCLPVLHLRSDPSPPSIPPGSADSCSLSFSDQSRMVYNFLRGHAVSRPSRGGGVAIQLISQNPSAYLGVQPPHASNVVCVCVCVLYVYLLFTLRITLLLCDQNNHPSPSQLLLRVF